jgi:ribonuclease HI
MPEIAIAPGEFALYSDACIRAGWRHYSVGGKPQPKRYGPAMGAWIGWLGCPPRTRPTVAGQAYLGQHGNNKAEYVAAIHALQAVLVHARLKQIAVERVVLRVDNEVVAKTLKHEWATTDLTPHRVLAEETKAEMEAAGTKVEIQQVSRTNHEFRRAHTMSQQAWDQVLVKTEWRPPKKPPEPAPAKSSSTSGDELIIFQLP